MSRETKEEANQVSVLKLRANLSQVLGEVEYGGKIYVVTKNGRPVAQIVPVAEETTPSTKRKQRT